MKVIFTIFLYLITVFFLFVKPASAAGQCTYSSTQARVQPNIHEHWRDSYTISQGETFRIGSFHNGIDRFAEDTDMWVTGPDGFLHRVTNESVIRADKAGTYVLHVVTINQEGPSCRAEAVVHVVLQVQGEGLITIERRTVVFRVPQIKEDFRITGDEERREFFVGHLVIIQDTKDDVPQFSAENWEEYREHQRMLREKEQREIDAQKQVQFADDPPTFSPENWEAYRQKQRALRIREQENISPRKRTNFRDDTPLFSAENWDEYREHQRMLREQEQDP